MKAFLILILTHLASCSLEFCSDGVKSQICKVGDKLQDYKVAPKPFPALVNVTINIISILDVNEEEQTVSLQMKMKLTWSESRLKVFPKQEDSNITWYSMNNLESFDIWTPKIYFGNGVEIGELKAFGSTENSLTTFWFENSKEFMLYTIKVNSKLKCKMEFGNFPYDEHKCNIDICF